jgi:hypothetical protein
MIYAPQFSERDADEMDRHRFCQTLRMTFSQAVRNVNGVGIPADIMGSMAVFNLDFMGSAFGREASRRKRLPHPEIYPLNDFSDCLERTGVDNIVISMTVSDRMGVKITREFKLFKGRDNFGEQLDEDFLIPIINFHQYRVVKKGYRSYRRNQEGTMMWFFIYHITKDHSINPDEIDFARNPFKKSLFWGFNPAFPESWVTGVVPPKIGTSQPSRKRATPAFTRTVEEGTRAPRPKRIIRSPRRAEFFYP